jgi:hypothetical protein
MMMQLWREFFGEDGKLCLIVIAEADDTEGCLAKIDEIVSDIDMSKWDGAGCWLAAPEVPSAMTNRKLTPAEADMARKGLTLQ